MTTVVKNSGEAVRRSPVHEALEHLHPEWSLLHGMNAALQIPNDSGVAKRLALCDVSAVPRIGLKGAGCAEWLKEHGIAVPNAIYECSPVGKYGFIARTGSAEFLIEDSLGEDIVSGLLAVPAPAKRAVYRMQRQDASFLLSGEKTLNVLSETCGVDFSNPNSSILYSRVAGVSCAVLHRKLNEIPLWQLWCDNSYGMYLWETLLEIVQYHGGGAAGLSSFYASASARG
jgi:sarcosine oxidase subunit gamma